MPKSFDLNRIDVLSSSKNIFRLSEKEDEFSVLYIYQNFDKNSIIIERDYFSKTPCYFQIKEDRLIVSDNLKEFSLDSNGISIEDTASYIFTGKLKMLFTTFYKDVYRLSPGCSCEISKEGVKIIYKKVDFIKPTSSLLQLLKASIEKQTNKSKRIAAHVSGGLDSSGLAAILKTFYPEKNTHFCAVDTGNDTNAEKIYQEAFVEKFREKINFYPSETDGILFLNDYVSAFAEPSNTVTVPYLNVNLFKELKNQGYDTLVMGNSGDEVLGHGFEYIDTLIKNQDIVSLQTAFENISLSSVLNVKYTEWDRFSEYKKYNLTMLFFMARHRVSSGEGKISFFLLCFRLSKGFSGFFTRIMQTLKGRFSTMFFKRKNKIIANTDSSNQKRSLEILTRQNLEKEFQTSVSEGNMMANHYFYNLSKLFGIQLVSPFQDFDVLSYCENVPMKEKFGEGYGRAFYRKELEGILPELIQKRIHKTTFDNWQIDSIKKLLKQSQKSDLSPLLFKFVEQSFVNDTFKTFQNAKDGSIIQKSLSMLVFRILNVNIWLLSFSKNEKI